MKKRRSHPRLAESAPAHPQPIDPAELAAGYMFPELFDAAPFRLISQEADDSPFQPSTAVQRALPDMPPIDWDHVRRKDAEKRRLRRRR